MSLFLFFANSMLIFQLLSELNRLFASLYLRRPYLQHIFVIYFFQSDGLCEIEVIIWLIQI